jgi:hypothetical protein
MSISPNARVSVSYLVVAAVGAVAIAAAAPALAEKAEPVKASQGAVPPVVHLCSPEGAASTLAFAGAEGWVWRSGWEPGANAAPCRQASAMPVKFAAATAAERARTPKPLTVFLDGPTGYTFVYLAEDGWRFAGKVADRR